MRTALKNKQRLKYSLLGEQKPIYVVENDNVLTTEVDGTVEAVVKGYSNNIYEEPVDFIGNIVPVGSESYARGNIAKILPYGIDISAYDAIILMNKDEIPVTETSVIWHRSEPAYKTIKDAVLVDDNGDEVDDPLDATAVVDLQTVDENSANYLVKRVATSQHISLILLKRINENANS